MEALSSEALLVEALPIDLPIEALLLDALSSDTCDLESASSGRRAGVVCSSRFTAVLQSLPEELAEPGDPDDCGGLVAGVLPTGLAEVAGSLIAGVRPTDLVEATV